MDDDEGRHLVRIVRRHVIGRANIARHGTRSQTRTVVPGLVQGAAVSSIWSGERLRKKEWICRSRPGQVTAVFAT
jgi:hypothetical protein